MVARTIAIALRLEIEARIPVERVEQRRKLLGGARTVHDQPAISEPPHHVEVHHCKGAGQWIDRLLHVVRRTEEAQLLSTERDENDGSCRWGGSQSCGHLDQCSGAGSIVVSPVVHLAGTIGIEAAKTAESQVIVMRAQHDRLVPEHGIAAGENANHIHANHGTLPLPSSGALAAYCEGLKPAAGSRLKSDLRKASCEVRRCGVGARRAGHAAFQAVVAEKSDVVEQSWRFGVLSSNLS